MASQNDGSEVPIMETLLVIWSIIVSLWTADLTPKYIPRKMIIGAE
jgi:hypothetical protein